MAHEIETTDGLVLHGERAWHGLGTIVQDAPTPLEALRIAHMDWPVEQWPLYATNGNKRLILKDSQVNVRIHADDTATELGIVGKGYTPIQNLELAEFCQALAEQGDVVKVETAGSIRGGKKVWFLLKGESFSVRGGSGSGTDKGNDVIFPYILASNGHDGTTALRLTPTDIRVVCKNTLSMVIPFGENENNARKLKTCSFVARHTGDMVQKIEDAKEALKLYGRALSINRDLIDELAAKDVTHQSVVQFLLGSYIRDFGAIPANPKNAAETKARTKAQEAVNAMFQRFSGESEKFGANGWTLMNAYTGWLQNDRAILQKGGGDMRTSLNLFGSNAERSVDAMKAALSI